MRAIGKVASDIGGPGIGAWSTTEISADSHAIRFLDGSTYNCKLSEMRKLSDKELFVLKLKGDDDSAAIYLVEDNN